MEVKKEKKIHTYLSNIFYYLFVVLVVAILVFSLVIEGSVALLVLLNILSISLIVVSVVITFYLATQMLRYNLTVRKKVQIGVFLIVIGFLLILSSFIKQITFGESFLTSVLGDTFFVYWGIGAIVVGIFIELTFLDQGIWELIKKPLRFLWNTLVSFFKWIKTHWKNIILYSLDVVSLAIIIYVVVTWEIVIWKLIILSLSCVYPIAHHYRRIWRAIRFIAVDVFYRIFYEIAVIVKRISVGVWNAIISFFKFIGKHWWIISKEFIRIAAIFTLGIIFWIFVVLNFYAGWVIMSIIIFQAFTRRFILKAIFKALKFSIKKIAAFFKKYWKKIVAELTRLIFFATGIVIIVLTGLEIWFFIQNYFYGIGIIIALIAEVFSRRAVWRFIIKHKIASIRVMGILIVVLGVVLEFTLEDYVNWLPLTSSLMAIGAFITIFARIIVEPVLILNFLKAVGRIIKKAAVALYNFLKKNWWIFLKEFMRLAAIIALGIIFWIFVEPNLYAGWIILFIIVFQTLTRIFILKQIGRFFKHVGLLLKDFLVWMTRPIRYIWSVFVNILRFFKENWLKVLLHTLDIVAIVVIIYFSIQISKSFEWWYTIIIAVSVLYVPIHHYRTVWRGIRFIAVDVFYRSLNAIYNFTRSILKGIWNRLVALANFIREHWWVFLKEFLRLTGATIGFWFILIYADKGGEGINFGAVTDHLIWIGIIVIVVSLLLSRKAVLKYFYNTLKSVVKTLVRRRVIIFRIFGLAAVIYGIVISFIQSWNIAAILSLSIGGVFLLFGHWIFHPKRFWEFLKKIPKVIKKILDTIWLTIRSFAIYVFDNFIWLVLLLTVLGSAAYGLSLVIGVDFLQTPIGDLVHWTMAAIGGGLILLAVVALLLLQRQFKKLRTGSSRVLAKQIKERWQE
ncbi:MAG: hypothetical protein H7641_12655 [Candidatus Heimdallarchaeota archaeon]|nr:hypothetical protein [Candidatus Heimdallarchaeota archaeon]MCK4878410.1 hypothetical protein [Candidatus Heimdallarchaeota archaeon]